MLGGSDSPAKELTFLDAARLLECGPTTPRAEVSSAYYTLLERNKEAFRALTTERQADPMGSSGGGRSNEQFILRVLKSRELRTYQGFTDEDEAYLLRVREALEQGLVAKNTVKRLKPELQKHPEPLKVLSALKRLISPESLERPEESSVQDTAPREVILSEFFARRGDA